jgi:hypothetical protein
LVKVIEESGLEEATKAIIETTFLGRYEAIKEYEEKVKAIVVTDETQVELMAEAKELRLELRKYRTSADKDREKLKAGSIKYGKAIQAAYNETERVCKKYEEYLEAQEKFAEIQAMKRAEITRKERQEHIAPYAMYVPAGVDLGYLSIDDFNNLYNGAKLQHEAAIKKAEEDAIAEKARLEADKIEIERLKEMNRTQLLEMEALRQQQMREEPLSIPPMPVTPSIQSDEEYLNDLANRLHQYPSRTMNTPETQKIYDAVKAGMSVIADEIIKSLGAL